MTESYAELIRQVYIDPIRSVLIVDDDFPTWDEVLVSTHADVQKTEGVPKKKWETSPEPIKKLIATLRGSNHNLILDIDDGSTINLDEDSPVINNLHQTDLMILDYQLDSTSQDGTKSIKIIRDINATEHFNLVILHTAADDLDQVFRDILLGLLSPCPDLERDAKIETALPLIEACDMEHPKLFDALRESIAVEQYIALRKSRKLSISNVFEKKQPFSAFKAVCDELGWRGQKILLVLEWAIFDFEGRFKDKMHNYPVPNLSWSMEGVKWIRSSHAFIAFTKKKKAEDLISDLQTSLRAWAPLPSRLLLAKLRKELEKRGSVAEDKALGNNYVLARWYHELLTVDADMQSFLLEETLNRHTEQLIGEICNDVINYGKSLVDVDKKAIGESGKEKTTIDEIVGGHFKLDLSKPYEMARAELEHNAFICSTKPSGPHLKTGHIFKLKDEYWVCLSPLCDLVPEQKTTGIFGDVGQRMPFIGVRFRTVSHKEFYKHSEVQSNRYVFVHEGSEIIILCINEANPTKANSAPYWYPIYAENYGRFDPEEYRFSVSKIAVEEKNLIFRVHETEVFCQLRYEYALNFMQKLGSSLTRIGLDFSGKAPNTEIVGE